jgi:hypothetical protein
MLKPMLVSFGIEMIKSVVDKFDPFEVISLLFLTPAKVKQILEKVIRKHLVKLVINLHFFVSCLFPLSFYLFRL